MNLHFFLNTTALWPYDALQEVNILKTYSYKKSMTK